MFGRNDEERGLGRGWGFNALQFNGVSLQPLNRDVPLSLLSVLGSLMGSRRLGAADCKAQVKRYIGGLEMER